MLIIRGSRGCQRGGVTHSVSLTLRSSKKRAAQSVIQYLLQLAGLQDSHLLSSEDPLEVILTRAGHVWLLPYLLADCSSTSLRESLHTSPGSLLAGGIQHLPLISHLPFEAASWAAHLYICLEGPLMAALSLPRPSSGLLPRSFSFRTNPPHPTHTQLHILLSHFVLCLHPFCGQPCISNNHAICCLGISSSQHAFTSATSTKLSGGPISRGRPWAQRGYVAELKTTARSPEAYSSDFSLSLSTSMNTLVSSTK